MFQKILSTHRCFEEMSDDGKDLHSKKKCRYVQHYRKKWEQIPQLRGWLSMFPNRDPENVKAFCKYCQRKLVPHVTGLLKHSACRAHMKNARAYMERVKESIRRAEEKANLQKNNCKMKNSGENSDAVAAAIANADAVVTINNAKEELDDQIEDAELNDKMSVVVRDDEDEGQFDDDNDDRFSDEFESTQVISDPLSQHVKIRVVMDDAMMSTHVLDVTKGVPVIGLGISLYKLQDGRWTLLSDSVTDAEGRCNDLLKDNSIQMQAGRYKMHYDVSQYYAIRNQECFFPFIEVVFDISNPLEKYHIPLLLSPFSYSTYRGC